MLNFHPSVVALACRKTDKLRGEWQMVEIRNAHQLVGREFDRIIWLRRPDQDTWAAGMTAIARARGDSVRLYAGEAA